MAKYQIPTAHYKSFDKYEEAKAYISSFTSPTFVVKVKQSAIDNPKASGLAAGKGVIVPETMDEAHQALESIMVKRIFGDAGNQVVIEEKLNGPEISGKHLSKISSFASLMLY
jgi:phosphoribosylamine-glycine ligase